GPTSRRASSRAAGSASFRSRREASCIREARGSDENRPTRRASPRSSSARSPPADSGPPRRSATPSPSSSAPGRAGLRAPAWWSMGRSRALSEADVHPIRVKPVRIYTTQTCPYCVRAKRLLHRKMFPYQEIDVSWDDDARMQLIQTTGQRTVPQVFIGDTHVGGSDDLYALEERGELDVLLQ